VERPQGKVALSISTRASGAADTLPTYRGFVLAMEELVDDPSPNVDLSWEMFDDHGDPQRTAELARQIVDDPSFLGVVGPMGSTEAFANAPIFDAAGLLQISPCASHPDLCERGYRTFHRLVPNERVQGHELARVAVDHLGASRCALVHDDDAFGTVVADYFTEGLEQQGGTVVGRIGFAADAVEPAAIAATMQSVDADVFVFAVHGHEGGLISSAARDVGVTAPFLGTDALKTSFFLGGGDGRGDAFHTHSGADMRRLESAREFRERYVARFPEDSTYSPEAYDAAKLVIEAIARAARPDRAAVLDALRGLGTFAGVTGPIAFTPTGERENAYISFYAVEADGDGRTMAYRGTTAELSPTDTR
jgi:branched-chain amino acid transport system substrate-binding protein